MLLNEICTPDVVYCSVDSTALAAARLMRERHVGDVVVVDEPNGDQTPIGVVTDRDIVIEVIAKEQDPAKVTVREIMRTPVVVAHATEEVSEAVERMKAHGVRRIPVMANRRDSSAFCVSTTCSSRSSPTQARWSTSYRASRAVSTARAAETLCLRRCSNGTGTRADLI